MLDLTLEQEATSSHAGVDLELGEVFTRRWVVDLILDLAGYTSDRDLSKLVAVEPSCGEGAFLGPMVERLLSSALAHGLGTTDIAHAIRGFDLVPANAERARRLAVGCLVEAGVDVQGAAELADGWVSRGDFLLEGPHDGTADFVFGNPPYIRLENVPSERSLAYRQACPTMRGRSDVFVGFIERGLRLLRPEGVLGFIVADRWMHNQYGTALRSMITSAYSVDAIVAMHDVNAFEDPVSAYPAITIVRRGSQGQAIIGDTTADFGAQAAGDLERWASGGVGQALAPALESKGIKAARLPGWFRGDESWPSGTPEQLAVVADLEKRFPPLEDHRTGTRIGIGVASGADSVYLTADAEVVEQDRLLPMVMARDIAGGEVRWTGTHLVNPWSEGRLVSLSDHPRLRAYLHANETSVRARHVAQRNPRSWYRTIDRVEPGLAERPKLLLPDLKAAIHPVLEEGHYYPHHNLYFVTTQSWDLEVLGGLLLSDVANLFVGTYCVKMRGGCYRFQAQYLRRIRVPEICSVKHADRSTLAAAFRSRDVEMATSVALRLYRIDSLP